MILNKTDLYEFLEEKHDLYNRPAFIAADPVSIPHLFSKKEDIEIAGFFAAAIAWGKRVTILKNAEKIVKWMDNDPYNFIVNSTEKDLGIFKNFTHRTFNGTDCIFFIRSLKNIYKNHGGLEHAFSSHVKKNDTDLQVVISGFRKLFFEQPHPSRTKKHIADPASGSAAKRLNMFLRWMVRKDNRGVDFGLWSKIRPAQLSCPLDVHSGNVARKLYLLSRKQNDWKAVEELTGKLREFDHDDPVKYDFALFGLGIGEKF